MRQSQQDTLSWWMCGPRSCIYTSPTGCIVRMGMWPHIMYLYVGYDVHCNQTIGESHIMCIDVFSTIVIQNCHFKAVAKESVQALCYNLLKLYTSRMKNFTGRFKWCHNRLSHWGASIILTIAQGWSSFLMDKSQKNVPKMHILYKSFNGMCMM